MKEIKRLKCTDPGLNNELKAQVDQLPDVHSEIKKVTSKFGSLTPEVDKRLHDKMGCRHSVYEPLINGFERFQKDKSILCNLKDKTISLVIGQSGSGKSCTTNSLVKGAKSMRIDIRG